MFAWYCANEAMIAWRQSHDHLVRWEETGKSIVVPRLHPRPLLQPTYHSSRHTKGRIYLRWSAGPDPRPPEWARGVHHGPESWRVWMTEADREWWERVARGDRMEMASQPYTPGSWAEEYRYTEEGLWLDGHVLYTWTELVRAAEEVVAEYRAVPPSLIGTGARGAHWDLGQMAEGGSAVLRQVVLHNTDRSRTPDWLDLNQMAWEPSLLPHVVGHLICRSVYYPPRSWDTWRPGVLPETRVSEALWGQVGHLHWNLVPELLQSTRSLSATLWLRPDYPRHVLPRPSEIQLRVVRTTFDHRPYGPRFQLFRRSVWDLLGSRRLGSGRLRPAPSQWLRSTETLLLHWEVCSPCWQDLPPYRQITVEVGPGVSRLRLAVSETTERLVLTGHRVADLDLRLPEDSPVEVDTHAWTGKKSARY